MLKRSTIVAALILLIAGPVYPCTWAKGYFYQFTQLRGKVVGAKLGPLQYARWLRQSFTRNNVTLMLYQYRWPIKSREEMPFVAVTRTDKNGSFDFGQVKSGHYSLIVEDQGWGRSDWFDVEIINLPRKTASVTVDISPHFPDCKGGHELVIRTK